MYTFWKRTAPPPSLTTFDAPDREMCTARRPRTNTPLQALVLLNDPTYVEAARKLAERMLLEGGRDVRRSGSRFAFRLATARRPPAEETGRAAGVADPGNWLGFRRDPEGREDLVAVGESQSRPERSTRPSWRRGRWSRARS